MALNEDSASSSSASLCLSPLGLLAFPGAPWLGGAVTFRLVPGLFALPCGPLPTAQGLPLPCSSGSRNGTLLVFAPPSSIHHPEAPNLRTLRTNSAAKPPTGLSVPLRKALPRWSLGLELRSIDSSLDLNAGACPGMSRSILPNHVRPSCGQPSKRSLVHEVGLVVSKHNTGRGGNGSIPRSR